MKIEMFLFNDKGELFSKAHPMHDCSFTATFDDNTLVLVFDHLEKYYDVSLDYIYGRTDNPQGRLYEHKTKYSPEMEKFVEMCFDPNSRANHQLKATLLKLLSSEGVTDD